MRGVGFRVYGLGVYALRLQASRDYFRAVAGFEGVWGVGV